MNKYALHNYIIVYHAMVSTFGYVLKLQRRILHKEVHIIINTFMLSLYTQYIIFPLSNDILGSQEPHS